MEINNRVVITAGRERGLSDVQGKTGVVEEVEGDLLTVSLEDGRKALVFTDEVTIASLDKEHIDVQEL